MNIEELLKETERALEKYGVFNPTFEAEQIVCHILSCDRFYLYLHLKEELPETHLLAAAALINERTKGRPLQYVLGRANFYGIDIAVDERVLIPRPETEVLVEKALEKLASLAAPKVLDLCTGSGAIAIAVAENKADAIITASDLSPKAYMLARVNAGPYKNIEVKRGDLFEGLGEFDCILTNPPYIPSEAIADLQTEVRDFEPKMALDGGLDGLDIIRRIIEESPQHLLPKGFLLMEIGDDQGDKVLEIASHIPVFKGASILPDLAGKDRILCLEK